MDKTNLWIIGGTVLALLLILAIVRPGITGYSVYQKIRDSNYTLEDYGRNVRQLQDDLLVSSTNLSACSTQNGHLLSMIGNLSAAAAACASEMSVLRLNLSRTQERWEESRHSMAEDYDRLEEELDEKRDEFLRLARSAARRICCKEKVDDASIDSYDVDDARISCLSDGEYDLVC